MENLMFTTALRAIETAFAHARARGLAPIAVVASMPAAM
jgi:hypothetical protein